jgi:D-alanine-D-alanine ligase
MAHVSYCAMLKLALIFGGRSAEHEISLISAKAVLAALDRNKYQVVPVGITREGAWVCPDDAEAALRDGLAATPCTPVALLPDPSRPGLLVGAGDSVVPIDFAFPILHGPFGEDGTIQGLFELADLAYAGAGVLASAVGMDKQLMKAAFAAAGLAQVDYVVLRAGDGERAVAAVEAAFAYPVFVKPVNLGSSVGISKAHDRGELIAAVATGFRYDRKVIVEAFADAREFECGVIGNDEPQVSVAGEVIPGNEFYDYEAKYTEGKMAFRIPAELAAEQAAALRELAAAAYKAVDCAGFARCDFFVERASGRVLINEINTIPGMTSMSAFPKVWAASGVPYGELIERIIALGVERHAARALLLTSRDAAAT